MTDRPILFSAPMVRAILDGRKTQTRRVVKPRGRVSLFDVEADGSPMWTDSYIMGPGNAEWRMRDNPYGVPGDRLWVRERCRAVETASGLDRVEYEASLDEEDDWGEVIDNTPEASDRWGDMRHYGGPAPQPSRPRERGGIAGRWVPSIHMPRWASRITLQITDVRVERLNEISEADALAEGVYRVDPDADDLAAGCTPDDFVFMAPGTRQGWGMTKAERAREKWSPTAEHAYRLLWEHINGPGSWDANPWVWVVTFERTAP